MLSPSRVARRLLLPAAVTALAGLAAPRASAEEGLWLFNAPPVARLRKDVNFQPTAQWLEHLQRSAVRFSGASGSLVSGDGLVMTNHHVGSGAISRLSTPEHDYLNNGFYARTPDQELKCPGLELKVLWSIQDMTQEVDAAAGRTTDPAAAGAARRAAMSAIEQRENQATGLACEVVTLYQGARYHLYRYKRYTDVRLVFAPEHQAAYFGGDNDNFEYPRFNLDCSFFRIYENGAPIKSEQHLSWTAAGVGENEPIFVAGHPGRTRRMYTMDHLVFRRDVEMPNVLRLLWRREVQLGAFAARSDANALMAANEIAGVANNRKRTWYQYEGMLDPEVWRRKTDEEARLRANVRAHPELAAKWGDAWESIAAAQDAHRAFFRRSETLNAFEQSDLFAWARSIVRIADESPKPSGERLREYADSNLPNAKRQLASDRPAHPALEVERIAGALSLLCETLGADDPLCRDLLSGKSPHDRAAELVAGTKLADAAERKRLVDAGTQAVSESTDTMIRLARALDPDSRALRKKFEDQVESVERTAYAKIAAAWFDMLGDDLYPDATGTLRLAYGRVAAIPSGDAPAPAFTTMGGMFDRSASRHGKEPFELPPSWVKAKDKIKLDTPFNFICTADIIGGNSGSPVVNARGEAVGLIFDSNLDDLTNDIVYPGGNGRAVAVDCRAIIEALRDIYGAGPLADELTRK